MNRPRYYIYIDESGHPNDPFYIVVALASRRKLEYDFENLHKELNLPDDLKKKIVNLVKVLENPELKGYYFLKKYGYGCYERLLLALFEYEDVVSVRISVLSINYIIRVLRNYIPKLIADIISKALLTPPNQMNTNININIDRVAIGNLYYVSSLASEDIFRKILDYKVPLPRKKKDRHSYIESIGYKVGRIQSIHEVFPKLIIDLSEREGYRPQVVAIYDTQAGEAKSAFDSYKEYFETLPHVFPSAWTSKLKFSKDKVIPKPVKSHCEKGRCPAGIWYADLFAHIVYKCIVEDDEEACRVIRNVCQRLHEKDKKSITIFVSPKEARNDKIQKKIGPCMREG